jgi:hypothetical protein
MKMKRVVQMVSATTDTGRLACDMYDLDKKEYYSEAQAEHIPIAEMDFQHLVRAFIKQLAKEKTNHCNTVDIVHAKDSIIKKLRKDLKAHSFGIECQEKIIAGLRSQVVTLSDKVKQLEGIIEEKDELIDRWSKAEHRWRKAYHDSAHTNGHYYTFCEVPQDEEGKEFVKNCKKYLNKESYAIRVRGQHLKKELYGQGRAYHGANMEDSSHMRVYIDKKKGDE